MDIGNVTVKDILEKMLGSEKADRILSKIDESYRQGKSGKELEEVLQTAFEDEGVDPGDITITYAQVVPTY